MKRFISLAALLILFAALCALEPPRNLEAEAGNGYVTLSWQPPVYNGMYEVFYHDGSPFSSYYQLFDQGYGAIYDLSDYEGCTLTMIDFRHSSYGIAGPHEYNIHLINWTQQTEIAVIEGLYTTVNDAWEQEILLGDVASVSQLGVFIEPLGNNEEDAYPVVDYDASLDGTSFVIDIDNLQILTPNGAAGDFLIDLWITPAEGTARKAPRLAITSPVARRAQGECTQRTREPNPLPPTRDLLGYKVYRGGTLLTTTPISYHVLTYTDSNVNNGQTYTYWVTAVYDEGESEASNTVEAMPQSDPSQLFFEGFEGGYIPTTWSRYDIDDDGYQWGIAPTGIDPYEGSKCIWSQSYDNGTMSALTPDNWIISPAISFTEACYLKFWVATQDPDWPEENYQVLLSTNGGNSVADFETVLWEETLTANDDEWRQVVVSLSQWTGQTGYFAWRHCNCTNNYAIKIDNIEVSTTASAPDDDTNHSSVVNLHAWPNPFNPVTTVAFSLESPSQTRVAIYNIRGERVAVLANEMLNAGNHEYVWQGCDESGRPVSSGLYFCRLESADTAQTCKLLLLK